MSEKTKSNHWKNSQDVIKWFRDTPNKKAHTFITFDICDFYPSITRELLDKALDFASYHTEVTEDDKVIIKHTKKTTLYSKNVPWCKSSSDFDVTMGSFDGAETCELVGLFLLSQLSHLSVNVGLYRDDGLARCTKTPKHLETIKKKCVKSSRSTTSKSPSRLTKKLWTF